MDAVGPPDQSRDAPAEPVVLVLEPVAPKIDAVGVLGFSTSFTRMCYESHVGVSVTNARADGSPINSAVRAWLSCD
jgi:hypothetical protein